MKIAEEKNIKNQLFAFDTPTTPHDVMIKVRHQLSYYNIFPYDLIKKKKNTYQTDKTD